MSINYFLSLSLSVCVHYKAVLLFVFFTLLSCEDLCREGEDFLGCSGHQLSMMALDLHGLEQMGETVSVIWDFYCNTFKVLMSDFFDFLLCFLLRAFPMGDCDIFHQDVFLDWSCAFYFGSDNLPLIYNH